MKLIRCCKVSKKRLRIFCATEFDQEKSANAYCSVRPIPKMLKILRTISGWTIRWKSSLPNKSQRTKMSFNTLQLLLTNTMLSMRWFVAYSTLAAKLEKLSNKWKSSCSVIPKDIARKWCCSSLTALNSALISWTVTKKEKSVKKHYGDSKTEKSRFWSWRMLLPAVLISLELQLWTTNFRWTMRAWVLRHTCTESVERTELKPTVKKRRKQTKDKPIQSIGNHLNGNGQNSWTLFIKPIKWRRNASTMKRVKMLQKTRTNILKIGRNGPVARTVSSQLCMNTKTYSARTLTIKVKRFVCMKPLHIGMQASKNLQLTWNCLKKK